LDEEKEADDKLTELAGEINVEAQSGKNVQGERPRTGSKRRIA
jgi:hypothetical protein